MRALYLSHTGMSEPLGRSQVVPYLEGLVSAGWGIDVVAFEPSSAKDEDIARTTEVLATLGIGYRWMRRSPSHALAVKAAESTRAFLELVLLALRRRPRVIHARSYLPAAVSYAVGALSPHARFLFDCRGLLGDEYVDFGHWPRRSFRYRLVKTAERQLFGRADAVVVLTDRLRRWLRDESRIVRTDTPVEVIPCCVDLERFRIDPAARAQARQLLGAGDRLVVVYSGTLGAWYCERQMAELFAAIHRRRPALLAVFSRAPTDRLRQALRDFGVSDRDVDLRPVAPTEMPRMLNAGDVAISFCQPGFSKIASSPVKLPEYLAVGMPVVVNPGVGDQDSLQRRFPESLLDAGSMTSRELDAVASHVAASAPPDEQTRPRHRAIAVEHFALDRVGIARYRALYEQMAG